MRCELDTARTVFSDPFRRLPFRSRDNRNLCNYWPPYHVTLCEYVGRIRAGIGIRHERMRQPATAQCHDLPSSPDWKIAAKRSVTLKTSPPTVSATCAPTTCRPAGIHHYLRGAARSSRRRRRICSESRRRGAADHREPSCPGTAPPARWWCG